MKKIVKIVAFWGNSGNSGRDGGGEGGLNSNHRGMGREKTTRDLGERIPWVPRVIPTCDSPDLDEDSLASFFDLKQQQKVFLRFGV